MRLAFAWWPPTRITRPWLPRVTLGGDEWHNPAITVILPPMGAFTVWRIDHPCVEGREHLHTWQNGEWEGVYDVGCPVCCEVRVDVEEGQGV